jgi:hypothetical protein
MDPLGHWPLLEKAFELSSHGAEKNKNKNIMYGAGYMYMAKYNGSPLEIAN